MRIRYFCIDGKEHHPEMDDLTVDQAVNTVSQLGPGDMIELYLDDEMDESGTPNIGLVFTEGGRYRGFGLGDSSEVSRYAQEALAPYTRYETQQYRGFPRQVPGPCDIPIEVVRSILTKVMEM